MIDTMVGRVVMVFVLSLVFPLEVMGDEPRVVRVAPNVYAFIGARGGANSGFVITERGVVVIDTQGPRELALLLKEKIRKITEKPILHVINTHYHGDHTFGNQFFAGTGEIIAHENTRTSLIEKDRIHRERFRRFFGERSLDGFVLTLPTLTFIHTLTLRMDGKSMVIIHPGIAHTDGDAVVFLPEDRVVFSGDIVYKDRLPWLGDGDTEGWLRALDMLMELDADVYVPGHGDIGGKETVRALKEYLLSLRGEVKRLMEQGKGLEEIKRDISLPEYSGYMKYREWLPLNAEKVFKEFSER